MPILDRRKDRFVEDQDTRVSVGIDFPFARVPNQDGYFKTTKTTVESIKNNIRLLCPNCYYVYNGFFYSSKMFGK